LSVLFNADKDGLLNLRGSITQDFREVHATCGLVYTSLKGLKISEGDTFIYMKTEWDLVSMRKVGIQSSGVYSILGYPKGVCNLIDQPYKSVSSLAEVAGIRFDKKEFTDFNFDLPLKNVRLAPLLYKYRQWSLEQNLDDIGQAMFLFVDRRGLVSKTYKELAEGDVFDLKPDVTGFTLNPYAVVDKLRNQYREDPAPRKFSYKQKVTALVGAKVEIQGMLAGTLGGHYKLHVGDKESDALSLVLVRQRFDSSKGMRPWTLTYGVLGV
jgi:hypothetical protein